MKITCIIQMSSWKLSMHPITKEKDYIDFEHALKREITFKDIYNIVGTKWFTHDIDFRDGELKLYGDSASSPLCSFSKPLRAPTLR